MSKNKNSKKELNTLLDAAAESVLELSDGAVAEIVREDGRDIKSSLAHFRQVLRDADKEYRQRHLKAAKEKHALEAQKLRELGTGLPASPEEQRTLLNTLLSLFPQYQIGLTFQNRNFESLPDGDVEEALKQLESLGVLEEFKKKNKGD